MSDLFTIDCHACGAKNTIDTETMRRVEPSSMRERTAPDIGVLHGGYVDERSSGGSDGLQPEPPSRLSTCLFHCTCPEPAA